MRSRMMSWSLLVLAPGLAFAQQAQHGKSGQGYGYVAPGGITCGDTSNTLQFGGGGEAILYRGIGIGGDIGYLAPIRALGNGAGLLSLNGFYQANVAKKISPFVTGGYTLGFRSATSSGFNIGGGIHYWFSDRKGLRLEFRDHVFSDCHFWQLRLGVDFR